MSRSSRTTGGGGVIFVATLSGSRNRPRLLSVVALVWSVAVAVFFALAPAESYQTSGGTIGVAGSLIATEGIKVVALLIPAILSLVAALLSGSALALWILVVVSAVALVYLVSFAIWFLPALVLLVVAAVIASKRRYHVARAA